MYINARCPSCPPLSWDGTEGRYVVRSFLSCWQAFAVGHLVVFIAVNGIPLTLVLVLFEMMVETSIEENIVLLWETSCGCKKVKFGLSQL